MNRKSKLRKRSKKILKDTGNPTLTIPITLYSFINDPKHNSYYVVDANMIIGYMLNSFKGGWNNYVDYMSLRGPRFFVTSRIASEITIGTIPPQFTILKGDEFDFDDINDKVENGYNALITALQIPDNDKYKTDIYWLLEAGYCGAVCSNIPYQAHFNKNVFAITANAVIIRKMIKDIKRRQIFETIINQSSLEHLANIRFFNGNKGTFIDYF
jgi:hypothetical protein